MREYFLGIPDEEFIRGQVPMTKEEVRILTLAKAKIKPADLVLDIGAGTGSLTVEAAFLAPEGRVYALEKNPLALELLEQNIAKFKCANISLLAGYAPEVMPPRALKFDVVLIGGSGGKLKELVAEIDERLQPGGRLVVNIVTLETLSEALSLFKGSYAEKYEYNLVNVQVTRMKKAGSYNLFDAQNPVYILAARKNNF